MSKDPDVITVEELADMSTQEIMDLLMFESYCFVNDGPTCHCGIEKIGEVLGYLPDQLCEGTLEEVDLSSLNFETQVSGLCPCQEAHFFTLKVENGVASWIPSEGKLMCGNSRIRIPNR